MRKAEQPLFLKGVKIISAQRYVRLIVNDEITEGKLSYRKYYTTF